MEYDDLFIREAMKPLCFVQIQDFLSDLRLVPGYDIGAVTFDDFRHHFERIWPWNDYMVGGQINLMRLLESDSRFFLKNANDYPCPEHQLTL